ncbi:iron ABC transporter substrate-binding protein [Fuchsiella alkaliacetigena]|uniref:iron ABC transporter substrate-binding protein n=1 Tax=Fuchsiella alkaliacetigena TaxID=957042 RepID=UPI00200B6F1F|nr:iron ABC transporter substrate-binding protein [Fuchsiella alkaliacetigena]MCK8825979.1 iron ABC transporter substrate-binding protein [Fuchsiella alkaliacetigena]
MINKKALTVLALVMVLVTGIIIGCSPDSEQEEITIYSGRSENLIGPAFEKFTAETGIEVNVRYGDTAELAATILEEGENTPADVFFAQDAGALGALAQANRLQVLPEEYLEQVDSRLRSPDGEWLGTSGRARVVAYNTDNVDQDELPDSIWGFTEPEWEGRIGWAPANGSFQAFVTALRVLEGEEKAEEWLRGIQDNNPYEYHNNTSTVEGVGRGEADVGFVNHYYLFRFLAEEGEDFPVRHLYTSGDAGSMINIAGVGVLDVASNDDNVNRLIEFLLTEEMQKHFIEENHEYPVVKGMDIVDFIDVEDDSKLIPLAEINAPEMDLSDIDDLEGTLELLSEVGAL